MKNTRPVSILVALISTVSTLHAGVSTHDEMFGGLKDFKTSGLSKAELRKQIGNECKLVTITERSPWCGKTFRQRVGRIVNGQRQVDVVNFTMAAGTEVYVLNGSGIPVVLRECCNSIYPVEETAVAAEATATASAGSSFDFWGTANNLLSLGINAFSGYLQVKGSYGGGGYDDYGYDRGYDRGYHREFREESFCIQPRECVQHVQQCTTVVVNPPKCKPPVACPTPTHPPRPTPPCVPTGPRESDNGRGGIIAGNGNPKLNQGGGFRAYENADPATLALKKNATMNTRTPSMASANIALANSTQSSTDPVVQKLSSTRNSRTAATARISPANVESAPALTASSSSTTPSSGGFKAFATAQPAAESQSISMAAPRALANKSQVAELPAPTRSSVLPQRTSSAPAANPMIAQLRAASAAPRMNMRSSAPSFNAGVSARPQMPARNFGFNAGGAQRSAAMAPRMPAQQRVMPNRIAAVRPQQMMRPAPVQRAPRSFSAGGGNMGRQPMRMSGGKRR